MNERVENNSTLNEYVLDYDICCNEKLKTMFTVALLAMCGKYIKIVGLIIAQSTYVKTHHYSIAQFNLLRDVFFSREHEPLQVFAFHCGTKLL